MKWVRLAALSLGLLGACEKHAIFEHTKAYDGGGGPVATPNLDAGTLLDASTGLGDDGAVVEAPVTFTKAGLLTAIGDCALGRYRAFAQRAQALADATRAYGEARSEERRTAAQAALRAALASWQELELFRFGPAASANEPGGRDLRNPIYYFPDINYCFIDQQIVSRSYAQQPLALAPSARGLGAIEYLLFHAGRENSCAQVVTINANGSWAQLSADELSARRAAYAAAVSEDVRVQAAALADAWEPGRGDYYGQFTRAGAGSTLFPTDQSAFNVVDNALYYVDKELKDWKVGLPVGLSPDCMTGTCPQAVESRWSLSSNSNIVANLAGFRLLLQGCGPGFTGLGFDDWLRAIGRGDLADRMIGAVRAAEQNAQSLPLPLEALLGSDRGRVISLYEALKAISDPLKADFGSALNLGLPMSVQGDND